MLTANPEADLEAALADWRKFRRRKRLADIHWIDAAYQAYLTAVVGGAIFGVASGFIGDNELSPEAVARLLRHADAWVGMVAALVIGVGLRSGSRGGPVALERAEVRHVLLAPVDRTTALLGPALRQARFLFFVGIVGGAMAGFLASQRLPGSPGQWFAVGALAGATLVGLSVGAAHLANGIGIPRWVGSLLSVILVGLAIADGLGAGVPSPTAAFGRLALWPVRFDGWGVAPIVVAVVLMGIGLRLVGNTPLEAAERRSTLVGQLRFAATLQDVRTVLVLRRQLAMELPRLRPWFTVRVKGTGRSPVFVRGLRGVLRWPAARVARMGLLAVVAGGALRAVWAGTTPMILLAGAAAFVAALDAVEPLAQEVDHPSRRDSIPMESGELHLRHVPIAVLVMVLFGIVAAVMAGVPGPGQVPGDVASLLALPLACGGVGGALVSVLGGPPSSSDTWNLVPPEVAGMRLAFRTAWPPAIAILGAVPVLLARTVLNKHQPATSGASVGSMGVLALFVLVAGWVRVRARIGEWWQTQMSMAKQLPANTADDNERDEA